MNLEKLEEQLEQEIDNGDISEKDAREIYREVKNEQTKYDDYLDIINEHC